ncbi:hypothetical protein B0J13DRAFT_580392 [Dactylonectria estremocensis]|uniref:C2H2-type domain-containing protein n=1 Tax=Dactylonectria estremocensis TaxID=1079267 RepID=A0A9P9FK48_9HYPO|nr:hypothetical protein B0J13DRAFT_580392 [Dactylonectria estremocensis]
MTSTFTFPPQHRPSTSSVDSSHQLPVLSRVNSDSLSPTISQDTPAGSNSNYPSDYSEIGDDPFFGADFNTFDGATPYFLEEQISLDSTIISGTPSLENLPSHYDELGTYPLTPEQTASIQATSPRSELRSALRLSIESRMPHSISPQELQKPFKSEPILTQPTQLTPSQSSSCRSSEDGLAPAAVPMSAQSPMVTVSFWGKDNDISAPPVQRSLEDSPTTVRGYAGDLISTNELPAAPRDLTGRWQPNPSTGHAGVGPESRTSEEVPSANEMAASRELVERNDVVGKWLSEDFSKLNVDSNTDDIKALEQPQENPEDIVPFNHETRNNYISGQAYYTSNGGGISQEDYDMIVSNRNWADAPMHHSISNNKYQPETSQAAMQRFERMCRDNDSIVSRAATWGTRRRSLPSVMDLELEEGNSGNILKKFSISSKPGGLLKDLRGLVRRPSANQLRKRNRGGNDEDSLGSDSRGSQDSKRDSLPHLTPGRMPSWAGKKQRPTVNTATALVSMAHNFASIGATHTRSGSISATPVTSPKSPFGGLNVKNTLRRPRSKSDLTKSTPGNLQTESHPSLVSMWRGAGGPPVANLATTTNNEVEEDEEDDDEFGDESEMKGNANIIDGITPDIAGFQQHILSLNPSLATTNNFLVERIAHQQVIRYKQLLRSKVSHLGQGANCPSGSLCIALGGSASILDQTGDTRELDPLSTVPDDDGTPTEGKINETSFPVDIPMPPTTRLPAEFECQLCYQSKKFQKPSDWTKHVHEDVQPFTCTWDKCREPKIFKRKADWVRHENEGHRHLEWWTCDVEGCHHQCYRRDNFLQHLVREHKFQEPKVKTKAAMKRSGGIDRTWQKVEQCHMETPIRPQDEPCRFCGKGFQTWKKLTVHLAKHMEQISLPVLRLVAAKAAELKEDTIISPVQDLPPRNILPTPVTQTAPIMQFPSGIQHQMTPNTQQAAFQAPSQLVYPVMPTDQFQQPSFYPHHQYESIGQNLQSTPMGLHHMNQGYDQTRQMQEIPYIPIHNGGMEQSYSQMNPLGLQNHGVPMGQMGYDGIIDPSSTNGSPFSGHGSMSPYQHSPNQNANNGNGLWDDKPMYR